MNATRQDKSKKQSNLNQDILVEEQNKKKTFVAGAAVLGIVGLFIKLLGAVFRVPLTNIIGASGMGYYQTAYPVYNMLLMVSTSGLPTSISRMVAERRAQEHYYEAHRTLMVSFKLMLSIGIVTSVLLFIFAPQICAFQLEPDAVFAMRATAPALLFCPVMSCFRGFFQGRRNMKPTAFSQALEQIGRVGFGLGLAYLLLKIDEAHAAAGASAGASFGGLFGLLAVLFVYAREKHNIDEEIGLDRTPIQKEREILKEILIIAIPITIGAAIVPILNWIDTLIVKRRLIEIGFAADTARTMFGELSGMAAPIINFPMVFTQAVTMSIVPVITDAYKKNDASFIRHNSELGLRYAFIIMLPCAAGLIILAEPVMKLLYPRQVESAIAAAGCLVIYAVGMIFIASIQAMSGILQGIGKQNIPVINLGIGAVIKVIITYILTGVPAINVKGAAIGTAAAYIIAAALNYRALVKYTGTRINVRLTIVKPLVSSLAMGACVWLGYKVAIGHFGNAVSTLISIAIGVLVYVIMIFVTKTITAADLESVPKLRKLSKLLTKMKLVK